MASSDSYLHSDSIRLRDMPDPNPARPKCAGPCYLMLVYIGPQYAEWRCERCLNYLAKDLVAHGSLF